LILEYFMTTIEQKYKIGSRRFGKVNWIGLYTLYIKEVLRFFNVWIQTILSPVVTFFLFLAVFSLAVGNGRADVLGHKFTIFLVPGLIVMQMMQNAFANTSSSLMISKMQGNIVDLLYPPLSAIEVTVAMLAGGITRGLIVGFASTAVCIMFIHVPIHNVFIIFVYGLLGSSLLASLGFLAGLWSEKFDNMAAVTNFIIVPLSFLSGTFYSIKNLNIYIETISSLNPFFYVIDGFRYGFLGASDGSLTVGLIVLIIANIITWYSCYFLFNKGYKIKF
jgi:ABC-2 type transport system permease protein